METSRFTALYAICVGVLMIAMWTFFVATGQVPEYETRPAEITLHLIAEFLTALSLLISGVWALRRARWASLLLLPSLGMLFYTMIVSPGYYVQQGVLVFVAMFAILLVLGVVALVLQVRRLLAWMAGGRS